MTDVLAAFTAELRRSLESEVSSAQAAEARCWNVPLRWAHEHLSGLEPTPGERYAAAELSIVERLGAADEGWPLPKVTGEALLRVDALMSVAAGEMGLSEESAYRRFRTLFVDRRDAAFRQTMADASAALAQLVRGLQSWDAAVVLASPGAEDDESRLDDLVREHAALLATLDELRDTSYVPSLHAELIEAIEGAEVEARQETDLASVEGMGRRVRRRWSESLAGARDQLRRRDGDPLLGELGRWVGHHEGLRARIALLERLVSFRLALRSDVHEGLRALRAEAVDPASTPLRDAIDRLRAVQHEAAEAAGRSDGDWSRGADLVSEYRQTTGRAISDALAALDREGLVNSGESIIERCIGAWQGALGSLPEVIHAVDLVDSDPERWPLEAAAKLTPREWAARTVDLERLSGARAAMMGVVGAISDGTEQAAKAPEVLAYNLEAALDEMRMAAATGAAKEDPWGLVRTGIDRSADFLERIVEAIEDSHGHATASVTRDFATAEVELLARIAEEDAWTAELTDAVNDAVDRARDVARSVRGSGREATAATGRVAAAAFGRARTALERARRLIGGGSSPAASDQTLRELSSVDAQAGALPFVYRRLFSPRPVEDPSLFVGRDADVQTILDHWRDWQAGRTNTLVVTGAFGGGMRSLLNAAAAKADGSDPWRRVSLERRLHDETDFARLLAAMVLDDQAEVENLDDLADRLSGLTTPRAVHVERFEHTFERTVPGFRLAEAAMEFFSRTDSKVAWFVTLPSDAWRLLATVAPTSAGLARLHRLGPLDEDGLAAMLRGRHERSGLALEFDEASIPPSALRDRKAPDAIERAYFSRFWSLTDGSAPLALLYWIRSARHEVGTEHVTITWPDELDFSFLDDLSWDQVFALQAFVEHGTLTVEDHASVFSMASDRSYDVLESLGNLYLIEPAGAIRRVGEQLMFTSVEPGTAYRIRPVLQSVVRRVLKARHLTG